MDRGAEIVRIEGFEFECPMPEPVGNALRTFHSRQALLLRLTTRAGVMGWGESWAFPAPVGAFIRSVLAPTVLGGDAMAPRAMQTRLRDMLVPDRRGLGHMALSAIDIAVWDCCGRIAGQPISALLGGRLREKVTAYASGPLLRTAADRYQGFEHAVESYAAMGFTGVKLRIGVKHRRDVEVIRAARAILGPDALLAADFNEGATVRQAVALANAVEDQGLAWLEEPVAHDNLPAYRQLAALLPVALAGGESFCGVKSFREPVVLQALDIIQPDLTICGGLSEGMRIAGLADAFDLAVAPHVWGTGVHFLAALQFAATLTGRTGEIPFPLFEFDTGYNPLRSQIYDVGPDANGMLDIPDGPGLGVDISIDRLSPFITGQWTVE